MDRGQSHGGGRGFSFLWVESDMLLRGGALVRRWSGAFNRWKATCGLYLFLIATGSRSIGRIFSKYRYPNLERNKEEEICIPFCSLIESSESHYCCHHRRREKPNQTIAIDQNQATIDQANGEWYLVNKNHKHNRPQLFGASFAGPPRLRVHPRPRTSPCHPIIEAAST